MYEINNELDKIGLLMQKTAYDFEATKDLSAKVNNGYNQLLQEKSVLIEKLGNVLPWDTEESLLSWRKIKPKMLG